MKKLSNMPTFAVLACMTYLLSGCAKSPEATIENFYSAMESGEISEAKNYISAQLVGMLGEAKLTSALASEAEKIQTCGGIKSIEIEMQGEGELRTGKTVVTFNGDCRPKTDTTKMIEEDGDWKITASK